MDEKYKIRWQAGLTILKPQWLVELKVTEPSLYEKLMILIRFILYAIALVIGFKILLSLNATALLIGIFTFFLVLLFNAGKRS